MDVFCGHFRWGGGGLKISWKSKCPRTLIVNDPLVTSLEYPWYYFEYRWLNFRCASILVTSFEYTWHYFVTKYSIKSFQILWKSILWKSVALLVQSKTAKPPWSKHSKAALGNCVRVKQRGARKLRSIKTLTTYAEDGRLKGYRRFRLDTLTSNHIKRTTLRFTENLTSSHETVNQPTSRTPKLL